jgi:CheY-like chemotaxis protein
MDGTQIAEAGRKLRSDLKVLFVTGYAETRIVGNIRRDAGTQILTKPFPIELLGEKVREMLDG